MNTQPSARGISCALLATFGIAANLVAAPVQLPGSAALPPGSSSTRGFVVRTSQGPTTPPLANNFLRALRQLNGTLTDSSGALVPNEALAGPNVDGSYDFDSVAFEKDGVSIDIYDGLGFGLMVGALSQSSQATNTAPPHSGITSVAFSPDGRLLVTNSPGGNVRLWDVRSGTPLNVAPAHLGTWQLRSCKRGDAEVWASASDTRQRVKLITDSHFTCVEYDTATGKVQTVAGGTYALNGKAYTQSVLYAGQGMTAYVGQKQSFTMRVEGDNLYLTGQLQDGTRTEEVWQRVR